MQTLRPSHRRRQAIRVAQTVRGPGCHWQSCPDLPVRPMPAPAEVNAGLGHQSHRGPLCPGFRTCVTAANDGRF